jgi:sec-independent protein translocase protein TatA
VGTVGGLRADSLKLQAHYHWNPSLCHATTTSTFGGRMSLSFSHILLVLIVILILFGAGKLPKVMGDLGKGIRNLREELGKDDEKKDKD